MKYHLARPPVHDVGLCDKSSLELMRPAYDAIELKDKKKEKATVNHAELARRDSGLFASEIEPKGSGRGSIASPIDVIGRSSFFVL